MPVTKYSMPPPDECTQPGVTQMQANARVTLRHGPKAGIAERPLAANSSHSIMWAANRRIDWSLARQQPATLDQGFGMRIVLIIKLPETANISTSGCKCQAPTIAEPPHNWSPRRPSQAAIAMRKTNSRELGIGVPS